MAGNASYIGLGGNLGQRAESLRTAVEKLKTIDDSRLAALSGVYETSPVQMEGPAFLNAVACIETGLDPRQVLAEIQHIEKEMGRDRSLEQGGSRIIDLDLLLFGDIRIDDDDITLPHPRMLGRRFVMEPLAEIAPERTILPDGFTASEIAAHLKERFPEQVVEYLGRLEEIRDKFEV